MAKLSRLYLSVSLAALMVAVAVVVSPASALATMMWPT